MENVLWKLDGLDEVPQNLGPCDHDVWVETIAPILMARMNELEDQTISYSMMAVVKDPSMEERIELAKNIRLLQAIEQRLDSLQSGWRNFDDADTSDVLNDVYEGLGITSMILDATIILASETKKLTADNDANTLMEFRKRVIAEQAPLRASIRSELGKTVLEHAKAEHERKDYGPFIQGWLKELAEAGELKGIAEKVEAVADEKSRLKKLANTRKY